MRLAVLQTSIKGNSRICDIWPSTYMTCLCLQSNFSKWKRLATFRYYGCFQILEILGTPVSQTSVSNWLTRFVWKEIFSSSRRRSIVKNISRLFWEIRLQTYACHVTWWLYIAIYVCFLSSMFLGMPTSPSSASNLLTRLRLKTFEPFLRIFYWSLWSYVM